MIRSLVTRGAASLLLAALLVFALTATASAHTTHPSKKSAAPRTLEASEEGACEIFPNPGTMEDIGEFGQSSSVATIIEVECRATYAEKFVRIASNELWSKCQGNLKWLAAPGPPEAPGTLKEAEAGENRGKEFKAELDDDGNATVAIFGGPSCAAEGGALVTVDLEAGTHPTTTTEVTINPPAVTPPGVYLYPTQGAIENATTSSLLGLAVIEFPAGLAEEPISITDRQLFDKCRIAPKLWWFGEDGERIAEGVEAHTTLDNDGNAYVVFEGGESCQPGNTLFEVSLEEPPFTTLEAPFKILPPQGTFEVAAYSIEKLQRIKGVGTTFVSTTLEAKVGQTVEYEIIVRNTGTVPLSFSNFADPDCEGITGGPGAAPIQPGKSAAYECSHELTSTGPWTNVATVEGNEGTGKKESNEVEVVVHHPEFQIEKLQRLHGEPAFTPERLTAAPNTEVEYEIVVKNTGDVPLRFSHFSDHECGHIEGGPGINEVLPGKSTTYICSRVVGGEGTYVNVATVEGNQGSGTKKSNEVEVVVVAHPGFTIQKLQRLHGEEHFTTSELTGAVGQTVEYEIVVTNTGDTSLVFQPLQDEKCEGIHPTGTFELAPGGHDAFTCSHMLSEPGPWTNVASVEGNEGTGKRTSNEVVVKVPPAPPAEFKIEKLQTIGVIGPTKEPLGAEIDETVQYEIVVTNTGAVPLRFSNFTDTLKAVSTNTTCEDIHGGPGEELVKPGESTKYLCKELLLEPGTYVNEASVTGTPAVGAPVSETSNKVEVKVATPPPGPHEAATIEKLQTVAGSNAPYTRGVISAEVGKTIDYKIVVTNTGNVELRLDLTDSVCDPGTLSAPVGTLNGNGELAPGNSVYFTCTHLVTASDAPTLLNIAKLNAKSSSGPGIEVASEVHAQIPGMGHVLCAREASVYKLRGTAGGKYKPFTVTVSAKDVSNITFYVDGRKLKKLTHKNAKHGVFTIKVDPRYLSKGEHHVRAQIVFKGGCKASVRSGFLHSASPLRKPEFTG